MFLPCAGASCKGIYALQLVACTLYVEVAVTLAATSVPQLGCDSDWSP